MSGHCRWPVTSVALPESPASPWCGVNVSNVTQEIGSHRENTALATLLSLPQARVSSMHAMLLVKILGILALARAKISRGP